MSNVTRSSERNVSDLVQPDSTDELGFSQPQDNGWKPEGYVRRKVRTRAGTESVESVQQYA